jgi:hypothetical protein
MIKDLRSGDEHPLKRIPVAAKIGNEYFDSNARTFFSNGLDRPDNMPCPTIREIISGYHGHNTKGQLHLSNRMGGAKRLVWIRRLNA